MSVEKNYLLLAHKEMKKHFVNIIDLKLIQSKKEILCVRTGMPAQKIHVTTDMVVTNITCGTGIHIQVFSYLQHRRAKYI